MDFPGTSTITQHFIAGSRSADQSVVFTPSGAAYADIPFPYLLQKEVVQARA